MSYRLYRDESYLEILKDYYFYLEDLNIISSLITNLFIYFQFVLFILSVRNIKVYYFQMILLTIYLCIKISTLCYFIRKQIINNENLFESIFLVDIVERLLHYIFLLGLAIYFTLN